MFSHCSKALRRLALSSSRPANLSDGVPAPGAKDPFIELFSNAVMCVDYLYSNSPRLVFHHTLARRAGHHLKWFQPAGHSDESELSFTVFAIETADRPVLRIIGLAPSATRRVPASNRV